MEVELLPVAMVPMGLVSSTIIYRSPGTSREMDSEVGGGAGWQRVGELWVGG